MDVTSFERRSRRCGRTTEPRMLLGFKADPAILVFEALIYQQSCRAKCARCQTRMNKFPARMFTTTMILVGMPINVKLLGAYS